jgi:hypothetical protein
VLLFLPIAIVAADEAVAILYGLVSAIVGGRARIVVRRVRLMTAQVLPLNFSRFFVYVIQGIESSRSVILSQIGSEFNWRLCSIH